MQRVLCGRFQETRFSAQAQVNVLSCRSHNGHNFKNYFIVPADGSQSTTYLNPRSGLIFVALLTFHSRQPDDPRNSIWPTLVEPAQNGERDNMASAMRSFVIGTLSVVFLVTASNAQQAGGGQKRHQQKTDRSATPTTAKADEKAYNAALKSIPNKPYDPWSGTR
jgi:hypothetical protein